ncbi:MAG: DedA family protein [Solirubrobacterales bacterium]
MNLRLPSFRRMLEVALGVVALLWVGPILVDTFVGGDGLPELDLTAVERPYLRIFSFVAFDAIVPIFPSESLLNAASTLASQGELDLGPIIVAGGLGAVVGDSALYWLSRTIGRRMVADKIDKAKENPKIATSFELLGNSAPLLIVAGRYVPGMRCAISASMGLERYPYPKFLLWASIGGFTWSAFTCVVAFAVGTKLGEYPVASILTSVLITTSLLALAYRPLKRGWAEAEETTAAEAEATA